MLTQIVKFNEIERSILRKLDDFGLEVYDLCSPPKRLAGIGSEIPVVEPNIDSRRVSIVRTPTGIMMGLAESDNWMTMTTRTLGRIYSAFLIAEDPQRRLDVHKTATLMHQVSLIQHILTQPNLKKVLIGDEVGLGKTIEAGLLVKRLKDQNPALRVLYLAPARLVANVAKEFREKLDLDARVWVSGNNSDARLNNDAIVIVSIHKAVVGDNFKEVLGSGPWDMIVVDECHHLSDWAEEGGSGNKSFRLVEQLIKIQRNECRLVLMSGTPHQGNQARFKNLLRLLSDDGKSVDGAQGRVIFRTKERVRDWRGRPLFPRREIRQPVVVELGVEYKSWYSKIAELFQNNSNEGYKKRAAGWAKGQALQWAASSVQAGLGYLVRLAIRRLKWDLTRDELKIAILALRPYRGGPVDESAEDLYLRLKKQIGLQAEYDASVQDSEEIEEDDWKPDPILIGALMHEALRLLESGASNTKWDALKKIIYAAPGEKIVFFAQPVETVGVVAAFLEKEYNVKPSLVIGNQSDSERTAEVSRFQSDHGPRFLVASKAGTEGLNMQKARYLVHLDVPWNPMEMEQRIGRVHRFGSKKTIIVETVVAAGSREVDMYRIAREKLQVIAKQLDPEEFENLFSRVMALVPPEELEEIIISSVSESFSTEESEEIGRLVTQGFSSWKEFDEAYRHEAERIKALDPGESTWNDLGNFMIKFGGATPGENVNLTTFQCVNDEIETSIEELPSIILKEKTFVCGDTSGSPAEKKDGAIASPLGLNIEEVQDVLRTTFLLSQEKGAGIIRRTSELDKYLKGCKGILVFLRQAIKYGSGLGNEYHLSFQMYAVNNSADYWELNPNQRAQVVRLLLDASRVKVIPDNALVEVLSTLENKIMQELRVPSEKDREDGIRYAIWPVAALIVV